MERADDSFKALQELVKAYPRDVEHLKLIADKHIQRAQNAARALKPEEAATENHKAVEYLEAALQTGGGDLNDYLKISELLRFSQKPEEFDHFTARAQQLYPGEPRMGYYRAAALSQLKEYVGAAMAFGESAKLAETRAPEILDDQFHFAWGVALERSAQFDEAAKEFQKSIDLTPPEAPPRAANTMNYLGYMWLDRGQHLDRAETLIRKANEMDPDNGAFVDSLGWLLFKQGKFPEALTELMRAEKLIRQDQPEPEPGDAEIYDHIAQTYDKLGQRDKALEYWKHALDVKPDVEAIRERAERELGIAKPKPAKPASPEEEKGVQGKKKGP
jgi:tetratricopeptide (TPR) repeat protein